MNKISTQKLITKKPKTSAEKAVIAIPSPQVISTILNYSKAYQVRQSEQVSFIETILN
jgi:hypothetical protein